MSTVGDTRTAPCTWCEAPSVVQTFRRYPRHTRITGGFWDTGNCPCGNSGGMDTYGRAILKQKRKDAHEPKQYHNGKPIKKDQ
jgi:hypothetical protein